MAQTLTQDDLNAIVAQFNTDKPKVTLGDGVSHGGTLGSSTATLALKQINVTNTSASAYAVKFATTGASSPAFKLDTTNNGSYPFDLTSSGSNAPCVHIAPATSGSGIVINAAAGHALELNAVGNGFSGIHITTSGTGASGITVAAGGSGSHGITIAAPGSGANGIHITASEHTIYAQGTNNGVWLGCLGAGPGMTIIASEGSGAGLIVTGGSNGLNITGVAGDGVSIDSSSGNHAINLDGGAGDIYGNLTGTVGSVIGNVGGNVVGDVTGFTTPLYGAVTDASPTASGFTASSLAGWGYDDYWEGWWCVLYDDLYQPRKISSSIDATGQINFDIPFSAAPSNGALFALLINVPETGGGGGLSQADVRTAIGLASANLDTQISNIPTNVLNETVDDINVGESLAVLIALCGGVATVSGSTVSFKKRDGTTTIISVSYSSTDGERLTSVIP